MNRIHLTQDSVILGFSKEFDDSLGSQMVVISWPAEEVSRA
jgi:hypothetical protein